MRCLDFSRQGSDRFNVHPKEIFLVFNLGKNVRVPHDEKSVLWVKLNNSQRWRSEPGRSVRPAGWSVWRLELQYNVIIWFCNPKVSSLAPVQRCCALNRLEIEETTRIWPQPHPISPHTHKPGHDIDIQRSLKITSAQGRIINVAVASNIMLPSKRCKMFTITLWFFQFVWGCHVIQASWDAEQVLHIQASDPIQLWETHKWKLKLARAELALICKHWR